MLKGYWLGCRTGVSSRLCAFCGLALLALAAVCTACTGGGASSGVASSRNVIDAAPQHAAAPSGAPTALPAGVVQPWERLDAAGRVVPQPRYYFGTATLRQAASINAATEYLPGVERYDQGGDVSDLGEASRVHSGALGGNQTSFATYEFTLGAGQPGAVAADVNLRQVNGGTGLSSYYLGLSNYSRNRWDWFGPFYDHHVRLSTGFAARWGLDYTSPLGRSYICVSAYNGASFDIVGLGMNLLDLADLTPPTAPTGLSATPVAGGLQLQWNTVLASDLAGYNIYWRQALFASPADPGVVHVNYVEGSTLHLLALPSTASHSVAVSAIDLCGNESPLSPVISATPLAGSGPGLLVTIDVTEAKLNGAANLTASGAASYDFDLDGDGVFDLTNATGLAAVDTSAAGLLRPGVRGTGGSAVALGGVSLLVSSNSRPVASAVANPQTGVAPLSVNFVGTASDIEDTLGSLTFAWDYNDDGVYEAGSNTLTPPVYIYNPPGMWNVKFRVTDTQGAWDVDTLTVLVEPKTGQDTTTVVPSGVENFSSMIMVSGMPAIAYQDSASWDVKYIRATKADGSAWGAPVTVWNEDEAIRAFSMIMVGNNPGIAWGTMGLEDLIFIRATNNTGGAWSSAVNVVTTDAVGFCCELVMAAGNPAIGYFNATADHPYFVRAIDANGAAWMAPVAADPAVIDGTYCTTAIVNGNPAMAYSDNVNTKVYYVRASDTAGSAWGARHEISGVVSAQALELTVISGVPCLAYGGATSSVAYFIRAQDVTGTAWDPAQFAARRPAGSMDLREVTMLEVNGRAVMALMDNNPYYLWYVEANDPTGMHWGWPAVVAPYEVPAVTYGKPSLVSLYGAVGICYTYNNLSGNRIDFTRRYY